METLLTADMICKFLSEKKANDIVKIYVADKTIIADYFVIASARSSTQVKALSEYVEEFVEKNGGEVRRTEGIADGRWAVIDAGDIIVHIFNDEQRLFYHLERIWGDGEKFVDEEEQSASEEKKSE